MQCDQLHQRLDELLDERAEVFSDTQVREHIAACSACRRLVGSYESMLLGVDLLSSQAPIEPFVAPAMGSANVGRKRRSHTFAAIAFAASVLIALASSHFLPLRAPSTGEEMGQSALAVPRPSTSLLNEELTPEAVARMLQETGRSLAEFPQTVRRVASHPDTDRIVGHIRPLTEPVGAAWETLLRAWPTPPGEGSPVPESDTSFVDWESTQYG